MTTTWVRHEGQPRYGLGSDTQTLQWVRRSWRPENAIASRGELLTHAQKRIAELLGREAPGRDQGWRPVTSRTASFAMALLDLLMHADDLATPQIAPTPEGGLSIEWLVDGDSLSVNIDDDGLTIVAELDNGEYALQPFTWEFSNEIDDRIRFAITSAAGYLSKISTGVQHRLISQ